MEGNEIDFLDWLGLVLLAQSAVHARAYEQRETAAAGGRQEQDRLPPRLLRLPGYRWRKASAGSR
jgi:hypothetical protein